VTWCERETEWLLAGKHVYFAPDDERGIAMFEQHLRDRELGFVVHNRREVPAIVFTLRRRRERAAA
jgi:hypothetical protein